MMFKNSVKLFLANFSVFWKLLVYKLLIIGITVVLFLPVMSAWISSFNSLNMVSVFNEFLNSTLIVNIQNMLSSLYVLVETIINAVVVLFQSNVFAVVYTFFLLFLLMPFLMGLSSIPTGESIYSYMSSLTKSSFTSNFVSKLGSSCVYSIYRTLINLPFLMVVLAGVYGILRLTLLGEMVRIFVPLILVVFLLVVYSLMTTTFAGWMPSCVVNKSTASKSFKKGFKAVSRRYFRVLSSIIMIYLIAICLFCMISAYSLIILIPLVNATIIMLEMVMFFESQGMRYYVDLDNVVSPKKLEQCDKISKMKDLI